MDIGYTILFFINGSRVETVEIFFFLGKLFLVMNKQEYSSEQQLHVENIFYRKSNV